MKYEERDRERERIQKLISIQFFNLARTQNHYP